MTIDAKHFAAGMAVLGDTYGKVIEPNLAKFYKTTLDSLLTNEEFTQAVYATAATERFWPSPAVIVDKVRPSAPKPSDAAKLDGAALFGRIRDECSAHTPAGLAVDERQVAAMFGEPAMMALRAIGGGMRYRNLTESTEPFVRKDFADAYATAIGMVAARGGAPLLIADPRVVALIKSLAPRLSLPKRNTNRRITGGNSVAEQ